LLEFMISDDIAKRDNMIYYNPVIKVSACRINPSKPHRHPARHTARIVCCQMLSNEIISNLSCAILVVEKSTRMGYLVDNE